MADSQTSESALLVRAEELLPQLRERADEVEAARRLPADLSRLFAEAGFYRLCVPTDYGGLEASPVSLLRIVERLATVDGSSAWCVFIHATSGLAALTLPETTALRVFSDPLVTLSGVFAPRGRATRAPGGLKVNGRWQWGSGIANAQWVTAGCLLREAGHDKTQRVGVCVPVSDIQVLDTWHVSGLCGTGSTDFALEDKLVPDSHVQTELRFTDRPLYRFPFFGLLASPIAAISLGLARGAISTLESFASDKTPDGSRRSLANRPTTQVDMAKAEAMVRSARSYLYESVEAAYNGEGQPSVNERMHLRLATTHAVKASAAAVDLMYTLGGGTSVYRSCPLQRSFRDVHVATQHMMVSDSTLELAGRVLLGQEVDVSLL